MDLEDTVNWSGLGYHCKSTCLQKGDLVVLTEHAEAWDVLCKLHHVLHGVRQSDGAVLPHLVHRLQAKEGEEIAVGEFGLICGSLKNQVLP